MKDIKDINEVYFIGIGGIGMSALARYFTSIGKKVSGYDRTSTPLTQTLEQEGIPVHYEDNVERVPPQADVIVYTPAIPKDHKELNYVMEKGYPVLKRSDVLGIITRSSFNICVAGTHGKTTITTMVAHLLRDTGYGCNAFLGGIAANYNSNFWSHERNVCVIEADEYDRSFLKLSPDIAVISAMDADHLDIYGTENAIQQAFVDFSAKLKPGGVLFSKFGLAKSAALQADTHFTYSREDDRADVYASNVVVKNGGYQFDVIGKDWAIRELQLFMGGLHNVENAVVAIAIAHRLNIDVTAIKAAVAGFKGVKRRFENIASGANSTVHYIDDYAHHPEELKALITGVRSLYADKKCTVIFQPHLYTRTRDFADEFATSLNLADEVLLLPIYPARELPIEGVSSEMIAAKMAHGKAKLIKKDELLSWIEKGLRREGGLQILVTAGAGDIDQFVNPIKEIIEKQ